MTSKTVCELGDATITETELSILRSPNAWLNDNIITFYLEWAEQALQRQRSDPSVNSNVVLIHATAAFMLRILPPDDLTAPTGAKKTNPFVEAKQPYVQRIIIPINNSHDPEQAGGGSHWSLLLIDKPSLRVIHMDSSLGLNRSVALETSACISRLLGTSKLRFEEPRVFQQTNSHDCGVFVLLHIEQLLFGPREIDTKAAADFRRRLLDLILEEAARRQG